MFPHARRDPEEPQGPESSHEVTEHIIIYDSDDEPDFCVSLPSDTQGIRCQMLGAAKLALGVKVFTMQAGGPEFDSPNPHSRRKERNLLQKAVL